MKKEAKAADAQQMLRTLLEAGVSLAEAFPSPPPPPPAPPRRIKKLIPSQPRLTFVFPGTSSGAGAAAGSKRSRISTGTAPSDEEEEEEGGAGERSVGAHSVFGSVVKYPRSGSAKATQVRGSCRPDSPPRQLPFQVNSVVRPAAPPGPRTPPPGVVHITAHRQLT